MGNAYREDTSLLMDVDELTLVARMRVVLAVATLLTITLDPDGLGKPHPFTLLVFYAYTVQSIVILVLHRAGRDVRYPKLAHWLDVAWFGLLLGMTGPLSGFFFLFFFPIAIAAFRWGHDEGARVTLAGTIVFLSSAHGYGDTAMLANVLLRMAFLLGLGLMVSRWGEVLLNGKRRIALLRDVSRLSNPRFGVDHTIASVLEETRRFFGASTCIVLIRDRTTDQWRLRSAGPSSFAQACGHWQLDNQIAAVLAALPARLSAVYNAPLLSSLPWPATLHTRDEGAARWQRGPADEGCQLADLLGARSFICAPIPLRRDEGRIFVVSPRRDLSRDDAVFLGQVAAQAFPVIENIELLDRMASDAGRRERQKFSNDLHDTTVQPYIGLSHALQALARKSDEDSPIATELRQIATMADNFVRDLRQFARAVSTTAPSGERAFALALRSHAAEFKACYDVEIALEGHEALDINDRLGAELFQLVCEGMSNIRRHTRASHGAVRMRCSRGWLHVRIENDCPGEPPPVFVPRSISERAAALGGFVYVGGGEGTTTVHVDIPV